MNTDTDIPTRTPAADPVGVVADPLATPHPLPPAAPAAPAPSLSLSRFRLRRSRTDRMLGGVCGGLAESLGADAALLRVLVVTLTVITGGAAAAVYLAAWVLAPEA